MKEDKVNNPKHYTKHKWEVIDILQEFFPKDPLLWQCGKYLLRSMYKKKLVEDLQKMIWYANKRIEKENDETRRKRKRS